MRLDLKVNDQPNKWSSILVVSNTDLQEGEYGSRMPSFALTQNGELEVTVSFDRNKITGWKSGKLGQTWFNLRLRHYDGEFQIYLDNVLEFCYWNRKPQELVNTKLVLGNGPLVTNAEYRNLIFQGFSSGTFHFV